MLNQYNKLSDTTKGAILMAIGAVLLLYTMGLFTKFVGIIVALLAIAMIVVGFMRADLYRKIMALTKKTKD